MDRYNRAKDNPIYQLEAETGLSSREVYNQLKPTPEVPEAEIPQARKNYEAGKAFQDSQMTDIQQRSTVDAASLRTEVTLRPYDAATGTITKKGTIRADTIAMEGGAPKIYEMKSSKNAPYTPNQTRAGFEMGTLSQDYIVVGKRGGDAWKPGTVIPAGTTVETIRKL